MLTTHKIESFQTIAPSSVSIVFKDGVHKHIDLSPLIEHQKFSNLYGQFKNPEFFLKGQLDPDCRVPTWPDGTDLSPAMLYEWDARLPALLAR
jgi:hypothetical protein